MILNNLEGKKIILASASPRRHELLKGIGLDFEVAVKGDVDESFDETMPFEQVAIYLAQKKALAYDSLIKPDAILITADTVVCTDEKILNKPANKKEAFEMLETLAGKKHSVITGVCIKSLEKEVCFSSESIVYFSRLLPEEISYYINKYKPYV